jgi:tetratricopeptide (TPR) repeat protein
MLASFCHNAMSDQKLTVAPADFGGANSDGTTPLRPRRFRRAIQSLLVLGIVVLTAWLSGMPSMLLKAQAQRQLHRGRADQALSWLNWARKLNKADAELEFLTARTYRIQGDMNLTRAHLQKAWDLGFPVAKLEREQTLAMAQSGQFHNAEAALPGLLTDPRGDMTDICDAYVTGFIRTYRLGEAERLLRAWLADAPQDPRALLLRGKMNIDRLDWKAAEEDFRGVLTRVPEHAEAADFLAGVLLKQKQPEAALDVLPIAVKDPRTHLSASLREVECYRIQGQDAAARQRLQSILKEFPDNMQAHLELGSLESDAGSFESALVELERARELAPNSPEVRYPLAIALRRLGRGKEAKPHFDFVTRAREAVVAAMKLRNDVAKNPGDAELRCRIGTTLLDYGQTERGLVWLQSALDVNPRLVSAHQRLADYYESRADESEDFAKLALTHRKLASPP